MTDQPFDAEVLKSNPFYQPTLDLLWASKIAGELDHNAGHHLGNAFVGCFGTLKWMTGFETKDVIEHLMEVSFQQWMSSPEGIQ